ncbi:MAG: AbrB family transcriptional regulator [Candidatus Brocadia sp. WS118]|jgi:AbrB family looped-hinge helix DNA binding protein|nr:MAG: AbrB family transcriptional regulator [Candidatus Brocadia sp. WS118]
MITTLDKFGRVIIPKKLRERLGITTETNLNIHVDGKRIIIELIREEEPLVEKDGILVFTGKLQGEIDQFLINDRKRRITKLLTEG